MKPFVILVLTVLVLVTSLTQAQEKSKELGSRESFLHNNNAKINYSVGYQIGGDFKRQDVQMNAKALIKGIEDAIDGTTSLMNETEMRTTLVELKKKIMALQQQKKESIQKQYRDEGSTFLHENSRKSDVTTLASGLQYRIMQNGHGKKPERDDIVSVHYRGTLVDGTEFDRSKPASQPAQFRVDGVIRGWTEALLLMQEGDKWQLYVPPELGYGERTPLADRTLIFDVELVKVN